jgi:hypothetical protein
VLGTQPQSVPPHVFWLDASRLVYGRFVRAESGFEVEAFEQVELPAGLFGSGPLGGPMHDVGLFRPRLSELLSGAPERVDRASLVLPDAWLRVAFVELAELPSGGAKRDEVLRWKLKRQVPFRVEELRLRGVDVRPLPSQEDRHRLLLGFGIDLLLRQIEDAFASCGVRIGRIVNASLAAVDSVHDVVDGVDLAAMALVSSAGYSLTFVRAGEPLLHRFRALDPGIGGEAAAQLVLRDLKLTRTFLGEQLPGWALGRILLVCQPQQQRFWLDSLEQGLGHAAVALGREQLPLRGTLPEASQALLAPMVGAALGEVA